MTPRKRKATTAPDGPAAKRASKGRAVKKQDDPVWATENANSHLVSQDLHAQYCNPSTYESWTKEDWEEIHDCLPENAPFNDDGYSVPINYFKYDPDWRRLVREFQEDLGAGRYEPAWQKEAAKAMEERAAGKFDIYKEEQYEAFWGQKQRLKADDFAGESAKIKLAELVEAGRIRIGDDFGYRRVFEKKGGAEGKWMIEKELKIVAIEGSSLIVAIPPGRLKYARLQNQATTNGHGEMESPEIEEQRAREDSIEHDLTNGAGKEENHPSNPAGEDPHKILANSDGKTDLPKLEYPLPNISERSTSDSEHNGHGTFGDFQKVDSKTPRLLLEEDDAAVENNANKLARGNHDNSSTFDIDVGTRSSLVSAQGSVSGSDNNLRNGGKKIDKANRTDPQTGCIIHKVRSIQGLADKIVHVDGRINLEDVPIISNWRIIRLQRKNQDLGSLFDIREEFYVWKSPTIVKTPKKGREKVEMQLEDADSDDYEQLPKKRSRAATQKGAPRGDSDSLKKSSAERKSRGRAKGKDESGKNDDNEDVTAEHDNDDKYAATNSGSKRPNCESKAKKSLGQTRRSTANHNYDGPAQIGENDENEGGGRESVVNQVNVCQHCGKNYSCKGSLTRHVKGYCKVASAK